jgi:hypothetical protein
MESPKFHFVIILPPRASFNASRFADGNIVPVLEKSFVAGWVQGEDNWTIHSPTTHE